MWCGEEWWERGLAGLGWPAVVAPVVEAAVREWVRELEVEDEVWVVFVLEEDELE